MPKINRKLTRAEKASKGTLPPVVSNYAAKQRNEAKNMSNNDFTVPLVKPRNKNYTDYKKNK